MGEPALRQLDQDLPRIRMLNPALTVRQHKGSASKPATLTDVAAARRAAIAQIRTAADAIIAEARAEATAIVNAALAEARQQIAAAALGASRHIADEQPGEFVPPERVLVADIIRQTAERHGISARRLLGRGVSKQLVAARTEAIAMAYVLRPDLSLPALGRLFDNRDHTTILHAVRRAGVYRGSKRGMSA
ncbi:helix-turn-helix domain-containing protein [Mesorhizobium sp.]|uniref:helix-turn-helix domain-containing protein n=1 Tax=Mesorhizobium sp. TaxID=1871066 RepID=UPI00257FEE50|nr:helix-turn-helix domain-containing protein [Mesorhizobium sp.]